MLALQDKIQYKFEMGGLEMIEDAIVKKVEGTKVYCKTNFNTMLIFDTETKICYTDNTTFGAKRTLMTTEY